MVSYFTILHCFLQSHFDGVINNLFCLEMIQVHFWYLNYRRIFPRLTNSSSRDIFWSKIILYHCLQMNHKSNIGESLQKIGDCKKLIEQKPKLSHSSSSPELPTTICTLGHCENLFCDCSNFISPATAANTAPAWSFTTNCNLFNCSQSVGYITSKACIFLSILRQVVYGIKLT